MTEEAKVVKVWAPSRLELTLIDLSLGSQRVNGSAGIAISKPNFQCRVRKASEISVGPVGFGYALETQEFLSRLVAELKCEPVSVEVSDSIPGHQGFGSKTATLLAVGRATAKLFGLEVSTAALSQIAKRARTSGVGVNTFDRGGFLVDCGHPMGPGGSTKEEFVPTRFSTRTHIPKVLVTQPFPWPILVIVPHGVIVEGALELERFQSMFPMPRASAHEIAYIVCFQMAAAVIENDYYAFCRTVNELQQAYLKSKELELQSEQVRQVYLEALKHGIDAIGLSSNGPALYAFTNSPDAAEAWLKTLIGSGIVSAYWWTRSPTHGAVLS